MAPTKNRDEKGQQGLQYIFEEVFEIDDKDPSLILWTAQHGINTIDDLLQLRETEIVSSTFKLDDGTVKKLYGQTKSRIRTLIAFNNWRIHMKN